MLISRRVLQYVQVIYIYMFGASMFVRSFLCVGVFDNAIQSEGLPTSNDGLVVQSLVSFGGG